MLKASEIISGLNNFYGTEEWHRWSPLFRGIVLTDGALWLAENAECYWLMDAIGSYQPECKKNEMLRDMQFWTLKVDLEKKSATLICERDTGDVAFTQEIEHTSFPLPEIKLYCAAGGPQNTMVILLPGEY